MDALDRCRYRYDINNLCVDIDAWIYRNTKGR